MMKEILISILETFCPNNVFLQGTLNPEKGYPQKFINFFTTDSNFDKFYDNISNQTDWYVSVIFYSNDPVEVNTFPPQIIAALKEAGFLPQNAGFDVISDVETHTGFVMNLIYPQKIKS